MAAIFEIRFPDSNLKMLLLINLKLNRVIDCVAFKIGATLKIRWPPWVRS